MVINFDRANTSKHRIEREIKKRLGRRYTFSERWNKGGVGIGGIRYEESAEGANTEYYKANIEEFVNGLVVYLRNEEDSHVLLLPFKEITKISCSKKADILSVQDRSYMHWMLKMGFPYSIARLALLDKEIKQLHKAVLQINTDAQSFTFIITRNNYEKVARYINRLPLQVSIELESYNDSNKL